MRKLRNLIPILVLLFCCFPITDNNSLQSAVPFEDPCDCNEGYWEEGSQWDPQLASWTCEMYGQNCGAVVICFYGGDIVCYQTDCLECIELPN